MCLEEKKKKMCLEYSDGLGWVGQVLLGFCLGWGLMEVGRLFKLWALKRTLPRRTSVSRSGSVGGEVGLEYATTNGCFFSSGHLEVSSQGSGMGWEQLCSILWSGPVKKPPGHTVYEDSALCCSGHPLLCILGQLTHAQNWSSVFHFQSLHHKSLLRMFL